MPIGVISAVCAAFAWTFASSIWRSQTGFIGAARLNLIKNGVATLIFLPVLFSINWTSNLGAASFLFISGAIGIALGDTFYLAALRLLGTRRTLTIEATAPIIASLLGRMFLKENLSINIFLGGLLVSTSVVIVAWQVPETAQTPSSSPLDTSNRDGLILAFAAVLCGVIGALFSRLVLLTGDLMPIQTASIRLLCGFSALYLALRLSGSETLQSLHGSGLNRSSLFVATLVGTNIAILLQQVVFQTMPVGLGVTLLTTAPILALFFGHREGDRVSFCGILASCLAFLGVCLALL